MSYLLNLAYAAALLFAAPWLVWRAWRKGKYREGFAAKFWGLVPKRAGDRPCLWFHAVSVGEVNLLAPLLAEIARRRPDWECVVSTTTMTGQALARKKYADRLVFYCPLDFSWAVRRAMRRVRPDLLVLAELELWPNLIRAAKQRGAHVAIVNGRLGESSFNGYRRIRWLIRHVLKRINLIAVQNEAYAQRFVALGAPAQRVQVTGSVKFDGAETDRNNPRTTRLKQLAGFTDDDVVFLAGSTQAPEESLALAAYQALSPKHPQLRLLLVPRHPDRFDEVAALLDASGIRWQRRSALDQSPQDPLARALLVDTIGELGAWWGAAEIALVGGSLSRRGGQNMIEPAAYGAAVSFGPNTWNFRDVVEAMLAHDAAIVVRDGEQLTAFVRRALDDPRWRERIGSQAQAFVKSQFGATARTVEHLDQILADRGDLSKSTRCAA